MSAKPLLNLVNWKRNVIVLVTHSILIKLVICFQREVYCLCKTYLFTMQLKDLQSAKKKIHNMSKWKCCWLFKELKCLLNWNKQICCIFYLNKGLKRKTAFFKIFTNFKIYFTSLPLLNGFTDCFLLSISPMTQISLQLR